MGFTVCLRLRVTGWQLGMSDGVSAEEEGLDRFVVYIAVGSTEMQQHCLFESLSHISCISATNAFSYMFI